MLVGHVARPCGKDRLRDGRHHEGFSSLRNEAFSARKMRITRGGTQARGSIRVRKRVRENRPLSPADGRKGRSPGIETRTSTRNDRAGVNLAVALLWAASPGHA